MSENKDDLLTEECKMLFEGINYAEITKTEFAPKLKESFLNRLLKRKRKEPSIEEFVYLSDELRNHYILVFSTDDDGNRQIDALELLDTHQMLIMIDDENGRFNLIDGSGATAQEKIGFEEYVCSPTCVKHKPYMFKEKTKINIDGKTIYFYDKNFEFDGFEYPRSIVVGKEDVEKIYVQEYITNNAGRLMNTEETIVYEYKNVNSPKVNYYIKKADYEKAENFKIRFPKSKFINYVD